MEPAYYTQTTGLSSFGTASKSAMSGLEVLVAASAAIAALYFAVKFVYEDERFVKDCSRREETK